MSNWKKISEEHPQDGERVLVWDTHGSEVRILTYNDFYKVWDGEDGDDYECDLDRAPFWMELPEKPAEI